jgi:hypothetical protein
MVKKKQKKNVKKASKKKGVKESKKVFSKEDKQLIWILAVIALVFIIFLGTFYGLRAGKHFEFGGAEWWIEGEREGWGDLTLYHGRYPVIYGGVLYTNMNLWLRNDPRENNIPSDVDFSYGIGKDVVISLTGDIEECSGRSIVSLQLSQAFGSGLPWSSVTGAVGDLAIAMDRELPYADCFNVSDTTTVILVHKGKESKVYSEWGCYHVEYESCDDLIKVSEKLILELIKQLND